MPASSISRLPDDVLWLIFTEFCLHCHGGYSQSWDERPLRPIRSRRKRHQASDDKSWYSIERQNLVSLSLTCKIFRDVAQPILYHEFALGCGSSWLSDLYTWEGRLVSFMRTLARRRDLARSVQVIYVHTLLIYEKDKKEQEENRTAIQEAAHSFGIDLPTVWEQRLSTISPDDSIDWPEVYPVFLGAYLNDKPDLTEKQKRRLDRAMNDGSKPALRWMNAEMVAMLITLTPNLQYLSLLGGPQWPSCGLPKSALQSLGVSTLPLKVLDLGVGASSIIELAPYLETLNLHQSFHIGWPITTKMPYMRTLRLTDVLISAGTLQGLLSACTGGLVAFEYEAFADEMRRAHGDSGPSISHFHAFEAIEYLKMHKNTLQTLHLDLSNLKEEIEKIPEGTNLKEFTTLQHIHINTALLFGFGPLSESFDDDQELIRFLPTSVVSLAICRNGSSSFTKKVLASLADGISKDQNVLPFLKWVGCSGEDMSSALKPLFEARSIEFSDRAWYLRELRPYLSASNESSRLEFPNWDSDDADDL
ncbi:hypothetical protein FSARC_5898 [Fusarium sarcochroum]|uniref:F-box domain-containing protein n=1 Tax=Fusarium sarcochroum TaxID=1208366 RepID=A0A8H4TYL4_9HYPO|nr:hypothetical protein FSARC_5898 [Fusarium sarcochroum]